MKTNRIPSSAGLPRAVVAFVTTSAFVGGIATAQTNGTWNVNAPGNWSTPSNWLGGIVASGTGAIADFSQVDLTADHVVSLDAPTTIGTLLSQDATTASHSWAFGGSGPLTLDNGGFQPELNIINQALVISAPLDGTNGFNKTGAGTLELSGTSTYGGATSLAAGTLKTSGGDNRLPTGTTLAFTGTGGALDFTTSQSMAGLTVPDRLAASYTVNGGNLTLDGTAVRQFGPGGTTANPVTNAHSVTMSFAGLSSFTSTAPASFFRVGLKSGAQNSGALLNVATVTLADQNAITASTLAIGDVGANNHGGTSTLRLGRVNTLNVGAINCGASGRSNSNLLFDPGRTNPSIKIRHTDGTSAMGDWRVGQVANFQSSTWTDSVDLSGGTVDALLTNLNLGTADIGTQTGRGGTENASFTMGAGNLEAASLLLGRISSAATTATITSLMAANGTFTLNHPAGVLKATTLTFAENTTLAGGAGARSVSGTFNLTAGTLEATTIQLGVQTGNATATAALNWTDGTIRNLTPSGLAINSLPLNLLTGNHVLDATGSASITFNPTSTLSGTGGITKTGTGTVSLQGANNYTGLTDVQAGTLVMANSFPGGVVTVAAAATLDLSNLTLKGLPPLAIDGALILTGPVKVAVPLSGIPGTIPNALQYGSITGAANLKHDYRSASFTVGASTTGITVAAGIPLTWTGAGGSSWDVNTAVSWQDATNNPRTFFWADSVTFDSAGSGFPNVILTAEMQPGAVTVNEAVVDYLFTGPGSISGETGLTKNGAAKLTITTGNTNTGTTAINAGTVEIGNGGTTGSIGGGAVVNNAALVFNRSNNITVANGISGTGSVAKLGAGTMTVTADNGYTGGTTISGGALHVGLQSTTGSLGTGAIVNNGVLRLNRADGAIPHPWTFANEISGTGSLIVGQNTAGSAFDAVVTLTGNNSFTGGINVNSGGLKILSAAALGTGPKTVILTNGTNGRPQFYLDGSGGNITIPTDVNFDTSVNDANRPAIGNLAGDNVIEGTITLRPGGGDTQIKVIGGRLALNGQIAAGTTLRNLRLSGTAGAEGIINGRLTDGTNSWGLLVLGPNTWTLTNSDNNFTGPTNVNGGTLLINGTQNLATGNITVASGATLGGIGTIGGNTTVNAGGFLAPGTPVGTLTTVNSVVLNGTLVIETGGATVDRLDVGGTLDITNATIDFNELTAAGGSPIVLASYGALAGTQFANVIDLPAGYTLNYNYNSLNQIALVSSGGSDYNTWAAGFGLNPSSDGAATFDKDRDGLTNAQEYAFGLDPTSPSSVSPIKAALDKTGGTFRYTRRLGSLTGLGYSYESSTTLSNGPWAPFTAVTEVSNNGSPVEEITVTVPASLLTSDMRFVRVRAN